MEAVGRKPSACFVRSRPRITGFLGRNCVETRMDRPDRSVYPYAILLHSILSKGYILAHGYETSFSRR